MGGDGEPATGGPGPCVGWVDDPAVEDVPVQAGHARGRRLDPDRVLTNDYLDRVLGP